MWRWVVWVFIIASVSGIPNVIKDGEIFDLELYLTTEDTEQPKQLLFEQANFLNYSMDQLYNLTYVDVTIPLQKVQFVRIGR
jgi:hypothetical protein